MINKAKNVSFPEKKTQPMIKSEEKKKQIFYRPLTSITQQPPLIRSYNDQEYMHQHSKSKYGAYNTKDFIK